MHVHVYVCTCVHKGFCDAIRETLLRTVTNGLLLNDFKSLE